MKLHEFTMQGIKLEIILEDKYTRAEAFWIALRNLQSISREVYQNEFAEKAPVISNFIKNL